MAPTDPGKPELAPGSFTPNNSGTFTMTWEASTDTNGDDIIYTLERMSTGGSWIGVDTAPNDSMYTFTNLAEGTWVFRVKASDGSLSSGYSDTSDPVVIDKTGPTAPTATPDRAPEDAVGGWFLNTVTVNYGGSSDPTLADGSAGSGVASYSAPQMFNMTGTHNYSGTATDNAGNVSSATTGSVKVDATAPVVALTCPTGNVFVGSTAYANWTASDQGSGVAAGYESGQIALDTSTIGAKTATAAAGTAMDKVGLASAQSTCNYNVYYAFGGWQNPLNALPTRNTVKAGRAIPVKFSLGGDFGLDIFNGTGPVSWNTSCSPAPTDPVENTVTAGSSSLSYDAATDTYTYVWKSLSGWANACRTFSLNLNDGSNHVISFNFTK